MPSIQWARFPGRSKSKTCGTVDHGTESELKDRVGRRYLFGKKCVHIRDMNAELQGNPRVMSKILEEPHGEHVSKDFAEGYHHEFFADTRSNGDRKCGQPIRAEISSLDTKCMEDGTEVGAWVKEKQPEASTYDEVTDVDCTKHGYALQTKATLHSKSIKAMTDNGHPQQESIVDPSEISVDACDSDENKEYTDSIPRCGISNKLTEEPVVAVSGQTFERACIQAWLDGGNVCCPITHKALTHPHLIPNLTLKNLISSWPSQLGTSLHPSFSSCRSSFSTCPSLMASHQQSFVSCSSASLSEFTRDSELYSLSLTTNSSLPELHREDELHSHSSSSVSFYSLDVPMHGFSSTPTSSYSSACREREQDVPITQKQAIFASFSNKNRAKALEDRLNEGNAMRRSSQSEISGSCDCIIESFVSNLCSKHADVQRTAAAQLRLLAKNNNANRLTIVNAGALSPLIALSYASDETLQLEAITTLLNLSLNHAIKDNIIQEGGIEALVRVLEVGLSTGVKENAAAAIAHLAVGEEEKAAIGSVGAIPPLVDLLQRGPTLRSKKDAAAALYRLSSIDVNKEMMVKAGVTKLLIDLMGGKGDMVDKALVILGNLVSIEEGRAAFVEDGGIPLLLKLLQTDGRTTPRLAVRILFQLCTHSSKHRSLVLQTEPLPTVVALSERANLRLKTQVAELMHILIMGDALSWDTVSFEKLGCFKLHQNEVSIHPSAFQGINQRSIS